MFIDLMFVGWDVILRDQGLVDGDVPPRGPLALDHSADVCFNYKSVGNSPWLSWSAVPSEESI